MAAAVGVLLGLIGVVFASLNDRRAMESGRRYIAADPQIRAVS